MKKQQVVLAALVMLLYLVSSCDVPEYVGPQKYSCHQYEATKINPVLGEWVMRAEGGRAERTFFVRHVEGLGYVINVDWNWATNFGSRRIENGEFRMQWGEIGGTHCPTDGFCFSGHFPTEKTGWFTLHTHYDCEVVSRTDWYAEFVRKDR